MKEPGLGHADVDPDEVAEAVRAIQAALRRLTAAPGALAPQERSEIARSVETYADFVLAVGAALFRRVRNAAWERPLGPIGSVEVPLERGGTWQDLEEGVNAAEDDLLRLLDSRRDRARTDADEPDLAYETERLAQLIALTGVEYSLWRRLPARLANFGAAYGHDLGRMLDQANSEPPFSFPLDPQLTDGSSEERNE
jgi:hypothetical protein